MQAHRIMAVGWSSFLAACVLEFLVFAFLDPGEIPWFGQALHPSRQAVYALSFFGFWAVTALSSALAVLLTLPPAELNEPSPAE
ncbi:MAG: hypothetical protein QM586_00515 [Xenophilus sp.]